MNCFARHLCALFDRSQALRWGVVLGVSGILLLGFSVPQALAAECSKIKTSTDFRPMVVSSNQMPDPQEAKNATCGGIVATIVAGRPRTLNPLAVSDPFSQAITDRMFAGLLAQLADQPMPGMAEAFEVKSLSPGGQAITFTLRPGLQFAFDDPTKDEQAKSLRTVTAEDIRFTFENLVYPKEITSPARDLVACGDGRLPTVQPKPVLVTLTLSTTGTLVAGDLFIQIDERAPAKVTLSASQQVNSVRDAIVKALNEKKPDTAQIPDQTKSEITITLGKLRIVQKEEELAQLGPWGPGSRLTARNLTFDILGIGSNQITFTCNTTTNNFLGALGRIPILNKTKVLTDEFSPKVESSPKDFKKLLDLGQADLSKIPGQLRGLGTGPFVLGTITLDAAGVGSIELVRNQLYWKADERGNWLPYVDGHRIVIVADQGQALRQFRSGELDWFTPRPEDLALLQSDKALKALPVNDDIDVGKLMNNMIFWTLNWATKDIGLRTVFQLKEFRQAMSHATDRETMRKKVLLGHGVESLGVLSPSSPFFIERKGQDPKVLQQWEAHGKYSFDLEKANEILDKLGLRDTDGDGLRDIPNNFQGERNPESPLEFTLSTNAGDTLQEEMSRFLATDLKKIGVSVKLRSTPPDTLMRQLLSGDYEASLINLPIGLNLDDDAYVHTCSGSFHLYNLDCPKNPSDFEQQVDQLYQNHRAAKSLYPVTPHVQLQMMQQIGDALQILIGEYQPLIPIVQANALFAYRKDTLKNHGRSPLANHDLVFCARKCRGG